jgi:hypothetical protein
VVSTPESLLPSQLSNCAMHSTEKENTEISSMDFIMFHSTSQDQMLLIK